MSRFECRLLRFSLHAFFSKFTLNRSWKRFLDEEVSIVEFFIEFVDFELDTERVLEIGLE